MVKKLSLIPFAALAFLCVSCGGTEKEGSSTSLNGITSPEAPSATKSAALRVHLTDKPAEDYQEVFVTVASVRVHQSAGADEADGSWREIPVTAAMPVDLLTLRDGVLLQLCETTLTEGHYQQVRLALTPNAGSDPPYANHVTDAGGATHPLEVPSGTIKIVHQFSVEAGMTTDLVLDFVASESVKRRGNGSYFMQPVIKGHSTQQ